MSVVVLDIGNPSSGDGDVVLDIGNPSSGDGQACRMGSCRMRFDCGILIA